MLGYGYPDGQYVVLRSLHHPEMLPYMPYAARHVPRAMACHGPVPRSAGWDVPSWCPGMDSPSEDRASPPF